MSGVRASHVIGAGVRVVGRVRVTLGATNDAILDIVCVVCY